MAFHLATVSLLIRDYDEARDWFVGKLGFETVSDEDLGGGKRWLVVRPPGEAGSALLLAKAVGSEQTDMIGRQGSGRVWLFLQTDDFTARHTAMLRAGVIFLEEPRQEAYGTVAIFEDISGNRWDLIEPKR